MITDIIETADVREGAFAADSKGLLRASYRRRFIAVSNNAADNAKTLKQAAGIPQLGSKYNASDPIGMSARCTRVMPRLIDPLKWEVICEYQTYGVTWPEAGVIEEELHPLLRPSIVRWSTADEELSEPVDFAGNEFRNSAGDLFSPLPPTEIGTLVMTITRNEAAFNVAMFMYYVKAVNSDNWLGFARRSCKMQRIQGDPQYEQALSFYQITYEIWIRPRGNYNPLKIVDEGPRELNDDGLAVLCTDGQGQPTGRIHALDGNGKRLAEGANLHYLEFEGYAEMSFGALNLP